MLLLGLLLAACATSELPPTPAAGQGGMSLAVVDRGWHTDVALPVEGMPAPLAGLAKSYPGTRFLVFGFGDRDYYMSRETTLGQTFSAMFPGPGVLLVTALSRPPEEAFGRDQVVRLTVSPVGFDKIVAFLWQAFDTTGGTAPLRLGDGPYPGSTFYASSQTYDAFRNCNTWTAQALASGGLPIDPDGIVFAGQVMDRVRPLANAQHGSAQ